MRKLVPCIVVLLLFVPIVAGSSLAVAVNTGENLAIMKKWDIVFHGEPNPDIAVIH